MQRLVMCILVGALFVASAFAQGGGTSTTCTAPATGITTLSVERSLALNNISTTGNVGSNFNPQLLGQIAQGTLQIREQFNFNPTSKVLSSTLFAMDPTAGLPTALNNVPAQQMISNYSVAVDNVYFSCNPVPNVLMVGRIVSAGANNPFGANLNGAPVAISFGYTTSTPPDINNVVAVIAGTVVGFSPAGTGTLTLVTPTTPTPGGGGGNGPTIVVEGGINQITSQRQVTLSAANTTDASGSQVTYVWSQPTAGTASIPQCADPNSKCTLQASISNANTATPTVTFASGRGDYLFVLTATNAAGVSSTQVIAIRYIGMI